MPLQTHGVDTAVDATSEMFSACFSGSHSILQVICVYVVFLGRERGAIYP